MHHVDALRFLPPSTQIVIGVDVVALNEAAILRPYGKRLVSALPDLEVVKQSCGFDALADIDWVLAGIADDSQAVFIVSGNFTRKQWIDCYRATAKREGRDFEIVEDNGVEVWGKGSGEEMRMFWPSASVAVFSNSGDNGLISSSKAELGLGADLTARVSAADKTSALWVAGRVPSGGSMLPLSDMLGFEAAIQAGTWLEVTARADFASEPKAAEAEGNLRMGLNMIKSQPQMKPFIELVDSMQITLEGAAITVYFRLSAENLGKIEEAAKMMGGFP